MSIELHRTQLAAGFVLLLLVIAGCSRERTYDVRGRIAGFGDDARTVIIEHEEIPGLMAAMTMPFDVADSVSTDALNAGDAVAFELVVDRRRSLIHSISRLPDDALPEHPAATTMPATSADTAEIIEHGDTIPDAELVTHADTTLQLSDFRGRRILLTFIYTSCPLPDFCPLMSRHFAEVQPMLDDAGDPPVHMLSVSFDPATDTPGVLRDYAARYTDDLSDWTFATGDSTTIRRLAETFGVFYRQDSGEIIHNLVTAHIDADGVVRRIWRGNDWQPADVLVALGSTASR